MCPRPKFVLEILPQSETAPDHAPGANLSHAGPYHYQTIQRERTNRAICFWASSSMWAMAAKKDSSVNTHEDYSI